MSLYGQAPYDGYSGYGGFATDPGAPVRPYYNAGVGSYDPAVSQNYYQQNSVNTAYRGYRVPDSTMTAAQWGTPLAAAGIYAMTGMHKVFGAKGRLAAGWAARAAYASVGLSTKGGAFSTGTRGYMRGGEAMLRNSFRRAASFMTGKAYAPVAEEAISVARTGSLGVGAAEAIGGFAGEWIGGPLEAAWLGAKAANEGVFKPYAYSRAIADQALMQNSGVPYYGAGMGSVYTSTGLGSRGAASYGNAVEKYGMSNMFYSQQNAGHLAGLMQQAGLLSDKSTMPQLKSATVKALKDIRSILDVASLSGSEAIKMLSTYKQGGMSVSEGTKAIKKLAQYGALSGLGIKQLADQSAKPAMEQGASLGLIPAYAGQYGARVTANFESYYHRGLLRNSAYGVLGGPAGAQQLALGGLSAYANSPLGQVGLYNDYMARTGNAGYNMAGMMANFGSRFARNPMNQEGLMQLNEPYMQSQLLKSKNRGKTLRMAESFLGQINPEEITKKGASAGALEGILTSTEGLSTEQARRLVYEQIAKQKAAGNSADVAAKLQQDLRQMEMHEEHTGETWGGVPRFVEKNIYRAGTFTSGAARGVSSDWAGILHGFHEGLFDLEYGKTAYNMSKSARYMKDVETHKNQLKRALRKNAKVNGVVTGIKRPGGFFNDLQDTLGMSWGLTSKDSALLAGKADSYRRSLLGMKGPEAHNVGLIEQDIASGHFRQAQIYSKAMGVPVSIPTLKEMQPLMKTVYVNHTKKIPTVKWRAGYRDTWAADSTRKFLLDQKGAEAPRAEIIEQEIASGHFHQAQRGLSAMGRNVPLSTLKSMRPMLKETHPTPNQTVPKFIGPTARFNGSKTEEAELKAKYNKAVLVYKKAPNSTNWNRLNRVANHIYGTGYGTRGAVMSVDEEAAQSAGLPANAVGVKALENLGTSLGNLKGYKTFNDAQAEAAGNYFSGINGKAVGWSAKTRATLAKDVQALKDAKTGNPKFIARNNLMAQIEKDSERKSTKKFEAKFDLTKKAAKDLKESQNKINAKGVMQTMNLQGPVTMHAHNVTVVTGSAGSGGSGGSPSVKAQSHWWNGSS